MKRLVFLLILALFVSAQSRAQTVVVADDNSVTSGDASSVLDVKSVSKGFLAPRMTQAQRLAISSPATGLLVFQTNGTPGYYYYTGSTWIIIASGGWTATGSNVYYNAGNVSIGNTSPAEALDVTGNIKFSGALMPNNQAGTSGYLLSSGGAGAPPTWENPSTYLAGYMWAQDGNTLSGIKNFGTASNHDLPFITNNTEKMRLTTGGRLGIGLTAPSAPLHVKSTTPTTGTNPIAVFEDTRDAGLGNNVVMQLKNTASGNNSTKFTLGANPAPFNKYWSLTTDYSSENKQNFSIIDELATVPRIFIDGNNYGAIGLGTNTPTALLHVYSHFPTSADAPMALFEGNSENGKASITLLNNAGTRSTSAFILGGAFTSNQWEMGNDLMSDNSQNFYIYDIATANTRFFIDNNGNVGLGGNITPTEALDVTGNAKFSGTITGGSWNGSLISPTYGGTGVNNGSNTITLSGNLTVSAAANIAGNLSVASGKTLTSSNTLTFTGTDGTSFAFPSSSGTVVTTAITSLPSLTSAAALTTVGTIGTGVWQGTSIKTDFGGTGVTSYTAGDMLYHTGSGTAFSKITPNSTATKKFLTQTSSGAPVWDDVFEQTGLKVKGASANALTIKPNETLSAGRTLNLLVGAADRTLNMGGDLTVAGAGTLSLASGKTLTASNTLTFTGTDGTSFAFPSTSGTVVTTTVSSFEQTALKIKGASSNTLTLKPNETLSADRTLNILVGASDRTLNMGGDLTVAGAGTLSLASGKTLTASNSLTFTGTDGTSFAFPSTSGTMVTTTVSSFEQTSFKIKGGDANTLTIKPNETLTAGRTLNLLVGAADRTLNMGGDLTVAGAGTLSIASGKTLTASNTVTFSGTDGTTVALPTATGEIPIATGATAVGKITANSTTTKKFLMEVSSSASWINLAATELPGALIDFKVITSGTSYTPSDSTNKIIIVLIGGGGGGGGVNAAGASNGATGAGGGSGGWLMAEITLSNRSANTIAIGSGGTAGANNGTSVAGNGTSTTFTHNSITYTANGGLGGNGMTSGTTTVLIRGGAGAAVSTQSSGTNAVILSGGQAGVYCSRTGGSSFAGGQGGSTPYGSGGTERSTAGAGNVGTGYGSGGGGAYCTTSSAAAVGGTGAGGAILIWEYR